MKHAAGSFCLRRWALALFLLGLVSIALAPVAAIPIDRQPQQRIVAIGGAITETLYALGQEQKIVGIDSTSLYPAQALSSKPNIGYFRAFSAEGVLSLNPTLVIAAAGAGPVDSLKLLQESKVAVVRLPDDFTSAGVVAKIKTIGHLAHADAQAAVLAESVSQGFGRLAALRAKISGHTRVLFIIALQSGRPLVAGNDTAADAMIKLAGGVNVASGFAGYKQMGDESIIAASPDVIVMMANGKAPLADTVLGLPPFKTTPAAAQRRLVALDGLYLLGFGPRTPQAATALLTAFYPSLK
jgi:iron complex transport system substrate-binding protein